MLIAIKMFLSNFLLILFRHLTGKYVTSVLVSDVDGFDFVTPMDDGVIGYSLRHKGEWEKKQLNQINHIISHCNVTEVLVVGAHIGALAIPIAAVNQEVKNVTAVEANPEAFKRLVQNFHLNRISKFSCHNIAASENNGPVSFLVNTWNSGGSKRSPIVRDAMYFMDNPKKIEVDGYKLDDYLKGKMYDMIIMDIEGSEYFALQGMTRLLRSTQFLVVEFLPHHLRNVSNVSVKDFLDVFSAYFSYLFIPSLGRFVKSEQFYAQLEYMFLNDICDDGLIFLKQKNYEEIFL